MRSDDVHAVTRPAAVRSSSGARAALCVLLVVMAVGPGWAEGITGDHRLIGNFIEDGGIVSKGWLEVSGSYADLDGGRDLTGAATVAFRYGRDAEAGVVVGMVNRSRDVGAVLFGTPLVEPVEGTGFSDPIGYAKYRFVRSPLEMAAGVSASLPIADENRRRGPGVAQYGAFLAWRANLPRATLVWSLGASDRGDARDAGRARGLVAPRAGLGVLVPLSFIWTFLAETQYERPRFEGEGRDARLLLGLDWRPTTNLLIRGEVGTALTEAAPRTLATLSAAFHF
jgi:hypothetical protein